MRLKAGTLISLLVVAALLVVAWLVIAAAGWGSHAREWLNLLIRWTHVIIGIAWIGTSFYFIFLENSLERENVREELAGSLWAIHGGGFYHVEKYKVAPRTLPEKLHWFMWEAYLTWLTGVFMLIVVYYANARVVMIDPAVRALSPTLAIVLGVGSMVVAWFVYDLLCRTPLVERRGRFALLGFGLVVLASIVLSELLSGRAAYMHVGAMLGTLMAGNVFFVIIPSQRALVRAAERGEAPDPRPGRHAGLRSLHNNYLTLPVVFVMISSHFPFTYGHPANWAILAGLFLASVGVRHYLNLRERGRDAIWLLPLATVMVLVLAYVTAPPSAAARSQGDGEPVAFSQVETIVTARCAGCHAAEPTDELFSSPPAGVMLDSPERIDLATLPRDRFAGYAAGRDPGRLTTAPLALGEGGVAVNVAISEGGSLRAGILGEAGRFLEGFGLEACDPITEGGLDAAVSWQGRPGALGGRSVQLVFSFQGATLFALAGR